MVHASTGVELDSAVGLEVDALGVVAGEDAEGFVERVGVAGKREGQVGEVVGVDLGLAVSVGRSCEWAHSRSLTL